LTKAEGEECFILGNGPSLKFAFEKHEQLFKSTPLICVNSFPTTPEYVKFKPKYCLFLDPAFFMKDYNKTYPHVKASIENLIKNTDWKLQLLLPTAARNTSYIKSLPEKNPNISISYFNYTIVHGYSFLRHFLFKKNLGMPSCQNVVGAAIFIGLNLGYKRISLFGADHNLGQNLFVNDQNEVCMIHYHFYSDGKPLIVPVSPQSGTNLKTNISGFYKLCAKTFSVYYILEEYARWLNVKIYNTTEGSFIDAFERKKI
jgi:hypothetical protein